MSEPYDTKIIEDCPVCGGFLTGEVCHECEVYWEFANVSGGEQ